MEESMLQLGLNSTTSNKFRNTFSITMKYKVTHDYLNN